MSEVTVRLTTPFSYLFLRFDGRRIRVQRPSEKSGPRGGGFRGRGGYKRPEGGSGYRRYTRGEETFENMGLHDEDNENELNDYLPHTMSGM